MRRLLKTLQYKRLTRYAAREILDSRGNPTIEVDLFSGKLAAKERVPSGASTGKYEAKELRDGGKRYHGKGVRHAVKNIAKLWKHVHNFPLQKQKAFDQALIAVNPSKATIGANAMLGMSLAYAKLSARARSQHLAEWIAKHTHATMRMPTPYMNIINGGEHAGTSLAFQEHMIVPKVKTCTEAIRIGSEIYHELKTLLKKKYGPTATNVGDEGGFAPNMKKPEEPFVIMQKAVDNLGYTKQVKFAIDAAANSFYTKATKKKPAKYLVGGKQLTTAQLMNLYERLTKRFPITSIEDPFEEHQCEEYAELKRRIGRRTQIVGDDLTVSQPNRVRDALEGNEISCLLLKVNQVGTVSEAWEAAKIATTSGANVMVSHRSGETESTFIADLAIGLGCGQIKAGAPCRGERTAKYNRLIYLEEVLGKKLTRQTGRKARPKKTQKRKKRRK